MIVNTLDGMAGFRLACLLRFKQMNAAIYGRQAELLAATAHRAAQPTPADSSGHRYRKIGVDAAVDRLGPQLGIEDRRYRQRDIAVDRLEARRVGPVGASSGGRNRSVDGAGAHEARRR